MWKREDKTDTANFENVPVYNLNLLHSCRCVGGFRTDCETQWECVNMHCSTKVNEGANGG